jgi:hypothetical protein
MDAADTDPADMPTSTATTTEPAVGGPGRWRRSALPVALVVIAAGALAWGFLRPAPTVETVGEVPAPVTEVAPAPAPPRPIAATSAPMAISVPAIGVAAAPIDPVGLEADGEMEIPEDDAVIGWYEPSASFPDFPGIVPGSAEGTAVLSGHVDSRSQGRGVFYDLRLLDLGDEIEIVHADGTTSRFIVTGRTSYDKDRIPLGDIFVWDGPPRLALITCGGEFDRTARSYTDNIVVLAVPA